jgi:hypothetical protein
MQQQKKELESVLMFHEMKRLILSMDHCSDVTLDRDLQRSFLLFSAPLPISETVIILKPSDRLRLYQT